MWNAVPSAKRTREWEVMKSSGWNSSLREGQAVSFAIVQKSMFDQSTCVVHRSEELLAERVEVQCCFGHQLEEVIFDEIETDLPGMSICSWYK